MAEDDGIDKEIEREFATKLEGAADDDGFDRPWWNIRQAITWLMFGAREKVALVVTGHDGEAEESVDSLVIRLYSSERDPPDRVFENAESLLLDALARGAVQAVGRANNRGYSEEIPPPRWADLRFWYDPDRAGPYRPIPATVWHRLRVRREDLFSFRPSAPAEGECHDNAPASDLARRYAANLAAKRWSEAKQKRETVLIEAESVARERWKNCDDDHAKITHWLQNDYSPDEKTLPFVNDKLTNHLLKRMANVAREIGKPVKGEKKSPC